MRLALVALALLAGALGAPVEAAPAPEHVLQLDGPLTPERRAELAALGVVPEELPHLGDALARLTPAQADALRAKPWILRVDAAEPLERHLDASRALSRVPPTATRGGGPTGAGVTIAVLDSGLDVAHPDFAGRVKASLRWEAGGWRPSATDEDGHGTHVAGVAAGDGAASDGALAGWAPGAGLVSLGFGDAFTTAMAVRAAEWILAHEDEHGIRVVVASWGRAGEDQAWDPGDPVVRASDRLVERGIVVVFSASNRGPGAGTVALEAQNPNVLAVGAVDDAARPADFSARGPVPLPDGRPAGWVKPDVVAAGMAVLAPRSAASATPPAPALGAAGLRYAEMRGTSQAAPAVAGLAALLLEQDPSLSPAEVRRILVTTAVDLGEPGPDPVSGFGLVDARDALAAGRGDRPDRRNVLLAGGEDVTTASGRLVGASGAGLEVEPLPAARVSDGLVRVPFAVKPGATRVAFDFAATEGARVQAHLHDGETWHGPWSRAEREGGARVVRGAVDAPSPGLWTLVAEPAGAGDLAWGATVRVAVRACETCASVVDPRYLEPPARGGDALLWQAEDAWGDARAFLAKAASEPGPERVAAGVAAGLLVLGLLIRKVRGR